MTVDEKRQDTVYELSLDIDSANARVKELLELGPSETVKLIQMYLHSAQAKLREYCVGYGLEYSEDNGFVLAGDRDLRIKGEVR